MNNFTELKNKIESMNVKREKFNPILSDIRLIEDELLKAQTPTSEAIKLNELLDSDVTIGPHNYPLSWYEMKWDQGFGCFIVKNIKAKKSLKLTETPEYLYQLVASDLEHIIKSFRKK